MRMKYYVVDVFTDQLFKGNPAGVCVMDRCLQDAQLQNIARENNLSETAFLVRGDGCYHLRWFTPEVEVDLCGHATIASAFVLFRFYERALSEIRFQTGRGEMKVSRGADADALLLDFPSLPAARVPDYPAFRASFGCGNLGAYKALDFMVVLESEAQVRGLKPDLNALMKVKEEAGLTDDSFGVIVTAPGADCDFVSRFFAPNAGIAEDPVTGRAHCTLIPHWAGVLGKTKMKARQLSKRTGEIDCELFGERVLIGGKAVLYLSGEIFV